MATPSSPVDVCNLAVSRLSEESITSIEQPETETEQVCQRWYDHTRRSVLRMHSWDFAKKRVQLAALSESPIFEYEYAFELPQDFIRPVRYGVLANTKNYEIFGNTICTHKTNDGVLNLKYISDFKIVSQMDPLFVDFFSVELAINMNPEITASNSVLQVLASLKSDKQVLAYSIDGQGDPPTRREVSNWAKSRRRSHRARSDIEEDGGA